MLNIRMLTTSPLVVLIPLFLGGCVSGGFQGERDSAMGWWAMTTPGVLGSILGERDAAVATSRYEELERIGEREAEGLKDIPSPKLMPLCMSYSKLKRYNKLFPCLDRIEDNIRKGDKRSMDFDEFVERNPVMAGMTAMGYGISNGRKGYEGDISIFPFLMRAEAYIDLARYTEAVEQAKKAEANISPQWKQERWAHIVSTSMLGLAYALGGDRKNALKAVTDLESMDTTYPYTLLSGDKAAGLAKIHLALKDYSKALEAIEQGKDTPFGSLAKGVADMMVMGETKGEGMWVWQDLPREFIYNKVLFEVGRVDEAKSGYDKLLGIPQTRENGDIYWVILFDRGRIAEKEGDLKGAVGYYRQAIEVIEQQRSTINTETSKIGFVGDKQAVYRQLVAALFADRQYAAAFEYVERSKSRALVDMLAAKQDFAVTRGDPAKVKTLLAMANTAETEAMLQGAAAEKPQTRSLVVSARQQLNTESPELASLINVSSLAAAEIQTLIPADEALVEYYYNAPDLIAFVLTSKGLSAVRLDSNALLDNIRQYRKQLESAKSGDYMNLSRQLYDQLLRPVTNQINVKKLIVVAHGPLHYLPFNALHDGKDYLIERYSLRMLPSASVLKYLRTEPMSKQGNILAFGNPDLGNPKFDLAYAQAEAIAVTKNRPQSKVLLRKDANETAFRKYGGEFRYLHFATHGEFNADAPLKSALLLAKDGKNDGLLTVDKLYSIKLDADLVTLSACETGLGKIANGDDVVGLTRGFLYAGTSTIVASLWQVDDQATSYLMTKFYDNLKQTDKRESLRQAQLDTRKKYAHPYYWAAFQITGNAK